MYESGISVQDVKQSLLGHNSSSKQILMVSWDELQILKPIGKGSFGTVHKAIWNNNGDSKELQEVAIKLLSKHHTAEQRKQLVKELHVATRIGLHPNVISLFGQTENPVTGQIGIVMPFYKLGSLEDHLWGRRKKAGSHISLEVLDKLDLLMSLTRGLLHLHNNGIIHGDIATRNLLLHQCCQSSPTLVISDFGMAKLWSDKPLDTHYASVKGPLKWMAPEVLQGENFTTASDVFSFAVTCSEILNESIPWEKLTPQEAARQTIAGKRPCLTISNDCKKKGLRASILVKRGTHIQKAITQVVTQNLEGLREVTAESLVDSLPSTCDTWQRSWPEKKILTMEQTTDLTALRNTILDPKKLAEQKTEQMKTLRQRQFTAVTEFNILSQIKDIVVKCWNQDPALRPELCKIHEDLSDIYLRCLSTSIYDIYDVFPQSIKSCDRVDSDYTLNEPLIAQPYDNFSFSNKRMTPKLSF
jgi:serine/threonine protein kinase